MPKNRPFGVTLFLWMVLCLSVWGLLRLLAVVRWWDVLNLFHSSLSPAYLAVTGAGWMVAGLVLCWGAWTRKRWAYLAVPISLIVWLAEYWLERIFFQDPRANLTFMIAITIVVVAITLLITYNRKTKEFFLRSEEHEQPDQDPTSA
jgi:hypothetical protein